MKKKSTINQICNFKSKILFLFLKCLSERLCLLSVGRHKARVPGCGPEPCPCIRISEGALKNPAACVAPQASYIRIPGHWTETSVFFDNL